MSSGVSPAVWARAALVRGAALTLVWWAMSEGTASTWRYALLLVPLATLCSLALARPSRASLPGPRRLLAVAGLGGWFLVQSVVGGVDVARRCLRRRVDVDPVMVTYTTALPAGAPRVMLAGLNALMPGTLSVDLDGDRLHVHVLDRAMAAHEQLERLERRIAAVLPRR